MNNQRWQKIREGDANVNNLVNWIFQIDSNAAEVSVGDAGALRGGML